MSSTSFRRGLLSAFAALPVAAIAGPLDKPVPVPVMRYVDAGQCGEGSAFAVVNESSIPVQEVCLRASGQTGNWGEDRLGDAVLGEKGRLELDPGVGTWDLLLVRADGSAFTKLSFSSCATTSIRLTAENRVVVR